MVAVVWCPPGARALYGLVLSVMAPVLLGACLSPAYINRGDGRDLEQPKGDIGAIMMDPVTYAVREAFFDEPPHCIAVMPFTSVWDDDADAPAFSDQHVELVRRAFYASLAPSDRLDVELEQVDEVLSGQHRRDGNRYRRASLLLGCDSYLVGQVTACSKGFYGVYSRVEVGARVKVMRTRDGIELWQASHVAESHGGGLILSPFSVVTEIFDASSNARDEQIHRVTANLARRLVATIPGFDGTPSPHLRTANGPSGRPPAVAASPPQRRLVSPETRGVTVQRLNVRTGPGRDFPVMQQMARGTKVLAISDPLVDGWTQVRLDNGMTGYVASPYLSKRGESGRRPSGAATAPRAAPLAPVITEAAKQPPDAKEPKSQKETGMGTLF